MDFKTNPYFDVFVKMNFGVKGENLKIFFRKKKFFRKITKASKFDELNIIINLCYLLVLYPIINILSQNFFFQPLKRQFPVKPPTAENRLRFKIFKAQNTLLKLLTPKKNFCRMNEFYPTNLIFTKFYFIKKAKKKTSRMFIKNSCHSLNRKSMVGRC